MKLIMTIVLSATVLALSGTANEPVDVKTNSERFAISTNGIATCNLVVSSLNDGNVAKAEQERQLNAGLLFQTYFEKISGVKLPIIGLAVAETDGPIKNDIVFRTGPRPRRAYCYSITFLRGPHTGKLIEPPFVPRASLYFDADGPDCARLAISNFVEKTFGPPLSAIDDANYKWPKRPTLVIDADKFQTIQYPPEQK